MKAAFFLSIIIPTYNSAKTLRKCIESILSQSVANYEILIIDGASTDTTLEIIRSYSDERIKFISQQDNGVYDAMNKGIDLAKGDWLYFLGSDDELHHSEVLFAIQKEAMSSEAVVIYGNVVQKNSRLIYDGFFETQKIRFKNICHQAIFYHKSVFKNIGNYNIRYKIYADWEFNLRWMLNPDIKNYYKELSIAIFNEQGLSSSNYDEAFNRDFEWNYFRYSKGNSLLKKVKFLTIEIYRRFKTHDRRNIGRIMKEGINLFLNKKFIIH